MALVISLSEADSEMESLFEQDIKMRQFNGGLCMNITRAQIDMLRVAYTANKKELSELEVYISENGRTDDGLSDASASFEQGYNNALEFVFDTLGIS